MAAARQMTELVQDASHSSDLPAAMGDFAHGSGASTPCRASAVSRGSVDARADEHAVPGERRQPGSVVIRRGSVDARADEHAVPGRAPSAGIRQAITEHLALLAEAGGVVAEPGERRRIGYRLDSTPTTVAQQFHAGPRPRRRSRFPRDRCGGCRGWRAAQRTGDPGQAAAGCGTTGQLCWSRNASVTAANSGDRQRS